MLPFILREIWGIRWGVNMVFLNIYMEANQEADALANRGLILIHISMALVIFIWYALICKEK